MIKVRVGKPISVNEQNEYKTLEDYSEFLRKKTYMLANPFEKESNFLPTPSLKIAKSPKKIVTAANSEKMLAEVDAARNKDCRLLQSKNYEVFFTEANQIPICFFTCI